MPEPDFLEKMIDKRVARNPGFSVADAARRRRELLRALAGQREEQKRSQTAIAAAMETSRPSSRAWRARRLMRRYRPSIGTRKASAMCAVSPDPTAEAGSAQRRGAFSMSSRYTTTGSPRHREVMQFEPSGRAAMLPLDGRPQADDPGQVRSAETEDWLLGFLEESPRCRRQNAMRRSRRSHPRHAPRSWRSRRPARRPPDGSA